MKKSLGLFFFGIFAIAAGIGFYIHHLIIKPLSKLKRKTITLPLKMVIIK